MKVDQPRLAISKRATHGHPKTGHVQQQTLGKLAEDFGERKGRVFDASIGSVFSVLNASWVGVGNGERSALPIAP